MRTSSSTTRILLGRVLACGMAATLGKCNKLDCGSAKCLSALVFYFMTRCYKCCGNCQTSYLRRIAHRTMGVRVILRITNMKPYLSAGCLLLADRTAPSGSGADGDERAHPLPADSACQRHPADCTVPTRVGAPALPGDPVARRACVSPTTTSCQDSKPYR